jgi:mannose-1-phosphate guanylyltransferase/mannose-6-phosphate isomerase
VGEEIWLPAGTSHRLRCDADTPHPVRVMEVSLGTFDEADIERLQDDYGRA